jgi:muramoyltetrapeptide carboxypeptidase
VCATAGVVPEERLLAGVRRLEGWGLRVRVGEHVLGTHVALRYLAGEDELRAAEFAAAWMDPDVVGVVLARGGYGSQRVLDLLDWRRLAEADPKVLVGFSDVTVLHQAVAARLGLVTVHGHVVTSLGAAESGSAEELRRLLMEPDSVADLFDGREVTSVVPGEAEGVLVGGNLSMLAAEVGSPYSRPARDSIALLEDLEEEPYRLDRLLTQLLRAGWFEGVVGIVAGAFTDCGPPDEVTAVLHDRLVRLGVPMVTDFDFGHTSTSACVPLGVTATLDATVGSLTLAAPPLR